MARVGDQAGLPLAGLGQPSQHHVESLGETGEFVAADHRDGTQVVGAGHPFGGFGEPGHRPQARAGHHAARERRDRHADAADDEQHCAKPFQHHARRRQALGDQQRAAVVQMHGQHALVVGGAQRQQQLAGHHVLLLLTDGQRLALLIGGVDGLARVHQHRVDVGVGGALDGLAGIGCQRTAFDEQPGPAVQLVVDVVVQRPGHDDVDRERHQHHDHRHHRHREQHHPPSQRQRAGLGQTRKPRNGRGRSDAIRAVSHAARNPPRARCGSAAAHLPLLSCGADIRHTPPGRSPRSGSRIPTLPRGCGCG